MKENTKKLYNLANDAIEKLNVQLEGDSYAGIAKAKAEASEAVASLNREYMKEIFDEILADGVQNAAKKALVRGYANLYSIKVNRDDFGETAELDTKERPIDLIALERHSKQKGVFHNAQWIHWVEYLRNSFAKKAVIEISDSKEERERVRKLVDDNVAAATKACGKTAKDPTSISSLTEALQEIMDGILFEDDGSGKNAHKVKGQDVRYILYTTFTRGKGRKSVSVPNKNTLCERIYEVCGKIVTGGTYTVEYQPPKKK